ncbi:protein phosphatase 1 regulatory subunit 21 [Atheta coriaria]|uniref:protein phosphatase 1 regulatory subunit 21 n=1 Tax=Dalotia coriaria TaxID=877792 RepID=UPI0031F34E22
MANSELEAKYHKLANEYAKVRSQATVLKKAVLDEQSKILNYKDVVKEQEQKIRKHDQEMESLTFRNEQLRKRVLILQQELQNVNTPSKKGKTKNSVTDSPNHSNYSIIDEELQKRILENAQLASQLADKDLEVTNYKEKMEWLEDKFRKLSVDLDTSNAELKTLKQKKLTENTVKECKQCKENQHWKEEADRWKVECDLLRSRPEANEQLTEYYETQIAELIESKAAYKSEFCSLQADNDTLKTRLEHLLLEKNALESILEKSNEELHTTTENYKSQLDAMTEHLAAQNEKITQQCDEIQVLKHYLSVKK